MEMTTLKSFAVTTRAAYKTYSGAYARATTAIEAVANAILELGIKDERGTATKLCSEVFGHKIDKSSTNREVSLQSQFLYNAYCKAFNKGAYAPKKPRAARQPDSTPQTISDGVNVSESVNESVQGAGRTIDIASELEEMSNDAFISVLEAVAIECALRSIDSAEFVLRYNKKAGALESHSGKAPDKPRRNRAKKAA